MAAIVKTVQGLALASNKTVQGLAAASLKTINGQDATSGAPSPDLLWWRMTDVGGSTITADVGPNGTTNGVLAAGVLTLNGLSQSANSASAVTYGTNVVTAMGWFNATAYSLDATKQILLEDSSFVGGDVNRWALYNDSGLIYIYISDNAGNPAIFSIVCPSNGASHHIAAVMNNASSGVPAVYVDGVAVSVSTVLNVWASAGNFAANTLYVGARGAASAWFGGVIDDVRIYAGAVSAGNIAAIYAAGRQ